MLHFFPTSSINVNYILNKYAYKIPKWLTFSEISLLGGFVLAVLFDLWVEISSWFYVIFPWKKEMSSLTFQLLRFILGSILEWSSPFLLFLLISLSIATSAASLNYNCYLLGSFWDNGERELDRFPLCFRGCKAGYFCYYRNGDDFYGTTFLSLMFALMIPWPLPALNLFILNIFLNRSVHIK